MSPVSASRGVLWAFPQPCFVVSSPGRPHMLPGAVPVLRHCWTWHFPALFGANSPLCAPTHGEFVSSWCQFPAGDPGGFSCHLFLGKLPVLEAPSSPNWAKLG